MKIYIIRDRKIGKFHISNHIIEFVFQHGKIEEVLQ